jgi:ATP-dependent DNA helicase DinG
MYKTRVINAREVLKDVVYQIKDNYVYYLEEWKKKYSLANMPIDVSEHVGGNLFTSNTKVIITSATLSVGHDFSYIKDEIGMTECEELVEESPFDMQRQCLFIMPEIVNEPNHDKFLPEIGEVIGDIVNIMGGRTLVLFTSYFQLNSVYDSLKHKWPYLLKQGDQAVKVLSEEFRNNHSTVLLGTTSFWTGVDVQGASLSCLIMVKLPFASLDDPINVWLSDREGYGAFMSYSIPRAVLKFKQGMGRLIRHKDDVGVFVLLDNRLKTKSYGNKFLGSLPKMLSGSNYKVIPKFFGAHGINLCEGVPTPPPPIITEPIVDTHRDEMGLDDDDPFKEDF